MPYLSSSAKLRLLLAAILCLGAATAWAQNRILLDSLHQELAAAEDDSTRLYWHHRLAWNSLNYDLDTSLHHNSRARQLARALDDSMSLARSHYYQGLIYRLKGEDYDSALHYLQESLEYYERFGKPMYTSGPLFNIGVVHGLMGNHEKSLEYFYRELALNEAEGNDFGVGNTLNSLGSVYRKMGDYSDALKKYDQSRSILEQLDKPWNLANVLSNTGGLLMETDRLDEAQPFLEQALQIDRDLEDNWGIAYNLHRLGVLLHQKGVPDSAGTYLREAFAMRKKLDQKLELSETMMALGSLQFELGQREEGLQLVKEAARIATEINALEARTSAEQKLAQFHRDRGDWQEAYVHLAQYSALRDSVTDKEKLRIAKELETRYESAKKDQRIAESELEITASKAKIAQQRIFLQGSLAGLLALLIILGLLVATIRTRRKLNLQRLENMRKEQELMALKSVMDGEEKERSRIARELHDGLSSLLAAIKIQFNALQHENEAIETNTKFNEALKRLDEANREVRRIAHNMMPEMLIKYGLVEALSEYIAGLNAGHNMRIELTCYGLEERLPLQVEQVVYRVIQELLNNVVKHSKASEVMVQLNRNDHLLSLTVEDNGVGFVAEEVDGRGGGLGLANLRSRIHYLNGHLHITSSPNEGSSVYAEIELQPQPVLI